MRLIGAIRGGCWAGLVLLSGCASLAYRVEPPVSPNNGGLHYLREVPPVAQAAYQCGPAALESVIRYWGREADAQEIGRRLTIPGTRGVLNFTLAQYGRDQGFWTEIREAGPEELKGWLRKGIPPIVMLHIGPFWLPAYHFVVLKGFNDPERIFYANTGQPETRAIPYARFQKRSQDAGRWTLIFCPPERVDWDLGAEEASELALLLERAGQLPAAERWYRIALNRNPKNPILRFNLGNVYLKMNRLKEAKEIYLQLLKETPSDGPSGNNLAWVYLEENRTPEALRTIEAVLRNGAQRQYDLLDTLGLAYCRLKHYPQAKDCFREALEKVPSENVEARELIWHHSEACPPKIF